MRRQRARKAVRPRRTRPAQDAQRAELEAAVARLEEERERMSRYLAFGRRVSLETEPEHVGPVVLDELVAIAGADRGALFALEPETGQVSRRLAAHGAQAPREAPPEGVRPQPDGGEELVSPLLHGGRAVALLALERDGRTFAEESLRRVGDLAPQAGAAVAGALALQSTRERASVIRAVIDTTPDAIALLDDRGQTVLENPPMRIVRRALVESVRRPGGGYRTHGTHATEAGRDPEAEVRDVLEMLGTGRVFARFGAPVRDGEGRRIGRLVVLREITREREAERMKDEFFALVSHELRTPLTSILGYLELLLEDEEVGEGPRHFLEVVERNARRLLRLVGDLLFVAQVEAGRLALEPEDVDLGRLVREAVEAAQPRAEAAGARLSAEVAGEVPPLRGDRDRLGQVLDNLIANALKFAGGGRVTVGLRERAGVAELSVSDTGPGISAEDQARLFDRFFRADSAVRGAVPGVGLGLTIVKAICEAHGGDVAVESAPGAGATFRVRLPSSAATPRPPAQVGSSSAAGAEDRSGSPAGEGGR